MTTQLARPVATRNIHLLYSPTLACNLGCRYCYLGDQTRTAPLKADAARAVSTLRYALDKLREAILAWIGRAEGALRA